MLISTNDSATLSKFGIACHDFHAAPDNFIELDCERPVLRGLTINVDGNGNRLSVRGTHPPDGVISLIGQGAVVDVHASGPIQITAYVYSNAHLIIDRPLAIFGLTASIYADTCLNIGKGALLAEKTEVWTSDHHSLIDLDTGKQINEPENVVIEENVWVGHGATILKGVRIATGSVIASRALVLDDVEPFELWGGIPARRLRERISWLPSHPASQEDIANLLQKTFKNGNL